MSNSIDKFLKEKAAGCDENTFKSLLQLKEICNKEIVEIIEEYNKKLLEIVESHQNEIKKILEEDRKLFEDYAKLILELRKENNALIGKINALIEKNNN